MTESAPQSMLSLSPVGGLYVLDIGWPISFNRYKDRYQKTSKDGRLWRDSTIAKIWRQCQGKPEPLIGKVAIYWELWEPDNRIRRDLDNFTGKHILDCLVKADIITDDNMKTIVEEHKLYRGKWSTGNLIITAMEI